MSDSGAVEAQDLFAAALAKHRAGDVKGATDGYRQVIAIAPGHAPAHQNLSITLRLLGRLDEALAIADTAVALAPDKAASHTGRARVLMVLGRPAEALVSFERAAALDPSAALNHLNSGVALRALGRTADALEAFERAIALAPDYAQAHHDRGAALAALDRMDEALAAFDAALALSPDFADAHRNRGVALRRLRRTEEALAAQDRAIALEPGRADSYWYRSLCHLLLGNFAAGWRDYERRWEVEDFLRTARGHATSILRARLRADLDVEDVAGRDVLLIGEQGIGDVVMFASVLPDLQRVAGRVAVACDARLHRLFGHAFPAVEVLDRGDAERRLDSFPVVLGLGSLGRMFRNRLEDFPGAPYLDPRPETVARWAGRLGAAEGRRRVGISWRGGLDRTGRGARSMDLAQLRPLLDLPGCEFVSLQYGDPSEEVAAVNAGLAAPIRLFPASEIDDFDDLAGLVRDLDLVVSVQTALVHLTGALGVPGLVMVPATPEWRYGERGPTMPWYRSIRLFRQGDDADWAPVVNEVVAEARARLAPP